MKNPHKILMLVACVAIIMTVSCSQEQTTDLKQEKDLKIFLLDSEFQSAMVQKVGEVKANEMLQQINNPTMRTPIVYDGELCPGVVNSGDAISQGFPDLLLADFWYFSGEAGDVVSIQVDRVNCNMDPIAALFEGFGDTSSLAFLAADDDFNDPACLPDCPSFRDPLISGYVLPTTAVYTVAIWDFFSGPCATGPLTYNVTATGFLCDAADADGDGCDDAADPHPNSNQDATVIIDGCDSGIDNLFVTACSTMSDLIADCAAAAADHGEFVSCVTLLTNEWKAAGYIVGNEKGDIISCAAQSNLF